MKSPVLLCFQMSPEKAAKVRFLCMRFAIRFQQVSPEQWGERLGVLCGLPEDDAAEPLPLTDVPQDVPGEMMVMGLFPAGMASQFLQAMKRAKLPPVPLRAVLTPTNSQWTPPMLYRELQREREAVTRGMPGAHDEA